MINPNLENLSWDNISLIHLIWPQKLKSYGLSLNLEYKILYKYLNDIFNVSLKSIWSNLAFKILTVLFIHLFFHSLSHFV